MQSLALLHLWSNVVVLNFWASWCYPGCYGEVPVLERGWCQYREHGVVVVGGANQAAPVEAAKKFIRRFDLTFRSAPDPARKVPIDHGVYGVLETFFLDRPGRIRAKHVGAVTDEVFRSNIERLRLLGASLCPS